MKKEVEISQIGSEVIRKKAKKVKFPLANEDKKIIKKLIFTMTNGTILVGLSAPQIGVSKQIFIVQPRKTEFREREDGDLKVFVNPKIIRYSRKKVNDYEGCGSVANANFFSKVERSENIDIEFYSEDGVKYKEKFNGFIARIIQHEMDHLNGMVFVDRMSETKSIMSGSEYKKMKTKKFKK